MMYLLQCVSTKMNQNSTEHGDSNSERVCASGMLDAQNKVLNHELSRNSHLRLS